MLCTRTNVIGRTQLSPQIRLTWRFHRRDKEDFNRGGFTIALVSAQLILSGRSTFTRLSLLWGFLQEMVGGAHPTNILQLLKCRGLEKVCKKN